MDSDTNVKPFQTLRFLARDWSSPKEFPFGLEGGSGLLARTLQVHTTQHQDLKGVREHINECFEKLDCYLMPHPGRGILRWKISCCERSF